MAVKLLGNGISRQPDLDVSDRCDKIGTNIMCLPG